MESQSNGNFSMGLKEKWKRHWEKRSIYSLDRKSMSLLGSAFLVVSVNFLFCVVFFLILPVLYRDDHLLYVTWSIISLFIAFQVGANWLLVAFDRSSKWTAAKAVLFQKRPEDRHLWTTCLTCQCDVPPRAYHCSVCQMCVLRRDHHCYFTNSCVSYSNQRHFIVLLVWLFIGSIVTISHALLLLHDQYPLFSLDHVLSYVPGVPFVQCYMGRMSWQLAVIFFSCWLSIVPGISALLFSLWQFTIVRYNLTSYEAYHNIWRYNVGSLHNFANVFGSYGLLLFIIPLGFLSKPTSDGVYYKFGERKK